MSAADVMPVLLAVALGLGGGYLLMLLDDWLIKRRRKP